MQLLGRAESIKIKEVQAQALKISEESGFLCVYEKAKRKTRSDEPPSGRYLVCYRLWLDRDREQVGIMNGKDWKPLPEPKQVIKPRSRITQLNMRNKLTNPFYRQGRF